jgi:hypothetical protein
MRILIGIAILFSATAYAQQPSASAAGSQNIAHPQHATGCAQPPSVAEVQKMMDVVGSKKIMQTVMTTMVQQIFDSFKKMRPDIPPGVWDRVSATLSSDASTKGLLHELVPIYQRHFCTADVEQIIAFYESPAGRKLSAEMPAIQQEAFVAGRAYMGRMSQQLERDVRDELSKQGSTVGTSPKDRDNATPNQGLTLDFGSAPAPAPQH